MKMIKSKNLLEKITNDFEMMMTHSFLEENNSSSEGLCFLSSLNSECGPDDHLKAEKLLSSVFENNDVDYYFENGILKIIDNSYSYYKDRDIVKNFHLYSYIFSKIKHMSPYMKDHLKRYYPRYLLNCNFLNEDEELYCIQMICKENGYYSVPSRDYSTKMQREIIKRCPEFMKNIMNLDKNVELESIMSDPKNILYCQIVNKYKIEALLNRESMVKLGSSIGQDIKKKYHNESNNIKDVLGKLITTNYYNIDSIALKIIENHVLFGAELKDDIKKHKNYKGDAEDIMDQILEASKE